MQGPKALLLCLRLQLEMLLANKNRANSCSSA